MNIIYVDDEKISVTVFKLMMEDIDRNLEIKVFNDSKEARIYGENNLIDIAFLDIEMPHLNGIELAKELKKNNKDIRIIFVTSHDSYALEAFDVDAVGYLLKPYTRERLEQIYKKVILIKNAPLKKVFIKTFGSFDIYIDGEIINFSRQKPKELLALLIDKMGSTVTPGMAISCLWEEKENDKTTSALYRMTGKRLKEILENLGIGFILKNGYKSVDTEVFECDYYYAINGRKAYLEKFNEDYMPNYFWAENTNAKLYNMKNKY